MTMEQLLQRAARAIELAGEYFDDAHGEDADMAAAVALLGSNISLAAAEIRNALAQLQATNK